MQQTHSTLYICVSRMLQMKYILAILFLAVSSVAAAQNVVGIVTDKATSQPVIGATVAYGKLLTQTNRGGLFEFDGVKMSDSLKITAIGYVPYIVLVTAANASQHIELLQKVSELKQVDIFGDRNFKKDSLANRADYAKQFNYKHPRVIDAFGNGMNFYPGEFFSIDLLTLVKALTYKSTNEYKFNKLLKRDEHEQYVDEHFNRGIVSHIVNLQGDTLSTFLVQYRPTYEFTLKATGYDMEVYIKDCYKKFEADGFKGTDVLVKQN